jgi:hypothetical protein
MEHQIDLGRSLERPLWSDRFSFSVEATIAGGTLWFVSCLILYSDDDIFPASIRHCDRPQPVSEQPAESEVRLLKCTGVVVLLLPQQLT